ncbi:Os03g0822033, partial [Oryza sativa Japonica Group]
LEGLAEVPSGGCGVPGCGGAAVAAGDAERERLADEDGVGLPVLAPVPRHGHPPGARPLHARPHDVPGPGHVRDQHQVEVPEPVYREPNPSLLPARHPAVGDGDDAGAVLGDVEEHGHGEVEVGARRVAPAAVVGGEGVVGRAEVGGGDEDGGAPRVAPLPPGLVHALDLEARAAALPGVEQRRAQRRVVHP